MAFSSLIPNFLYSTSFTSSTNNTSSCNLDKMGGQRNNDFVVISAAPSEPGRKKKMEMFTPEYYAACSVGGMLSCGLTYFHGSPFELVKCNMKINPAKYKSIQTAFGVLLQEQGFKGFYRGLLPGMLGAGAQGACKFGFYEFFKKYYSDLAGPENASKYRTLIYLAGSASAEVIATIALCPFEAVKVRVQEQPGFARGGLLDGFPKFVKSQGGALGLYNRHLVPLWGHQIPYTMMEFASFETIKELMYKHYSSESLQFGVGFAGGYIAGVFCAIVSHPAETLVSFLNNAAFNNKGVAAVTVGDAVKQLGLRGLLSTRGLLPRIHIIGPLTGIKWGIYDGFCKLYVGLLGVVPPTPVIAPQPVKAADSSRILDDEFKISDAVARFNHCTSAVNASFSAATRNPFKHMEKIKSARYRGGIMDEEISRLEQLLSLSAAEEKETEGTLQTAFNTVKKVEIQRIGKDRFLVNFEHELDRSRVLADAPWNFDNNMVILRELKMDQDPLSVNLDWADFVIQVSGLPLSQITLEMARFIGDQVGTFIELVSPISESFWQPVMRIKIRYNITKPLRQFITLKSPRGEVFKADISYERLSNFCYLCGHLGHIDKFCEMRYDKNFTAPKGELPFGPRLRASAQRKPNSPVSGVHASLGRTHGSQNLEPLSEGGRREANDDNGNSPSSTPNVQRDDSQRSPLSISSPYIPPGFENFAPPLLPSSLRLVDEDETGEVSPNNSQDFQPRTGEEIGNTLVPNSYPEKGRGLNPSIQTIKSHGIVTSHPRANIPKHGSKDLSSNVTTSLMPAVHFDNPPLIHFSAHNTAITSPTGIIQLGTPLPHQNTNLSPIFINLPIQEVQNWFASVGRGNSGDAKEKN
ncbi:hypothetical protein BUALT_Bualt07G0077800 [Buddleja alternifolia]|uniref:Uncharacterized protein n=1 Tax=Buddleja alternifolia TaxID=168488 RepID=A0AAV6XFQ1_9LAMI|nr:hypothetical protein BUALT_Bualt07G0077800 [Buddleja alternifolia]